jgi:hypothetical protein
MLQELVIKVPAPFVGSPEIGFSARYPAQPLQQRLRDVPFIIEGPSRPMRVLHGRLELFRQKDLLLGQASESPEEAYSWTDLIELTNEVFLLAYRDESLRLESDTPADAETEQSGMAERRQAASVVNLVRPLVFPFLKDCVRIGQLALRDSIELAVLRDTQVLAELEIRRQSIVPLNGSIVLWDGPAA